VLWRAWLIGVLHDLVDPASLSFHAMTYLLIAAAFLPLRRYVYQRHANGWVLWGGIAYLLVQLCDAVVAEGGSRPWFVAAVSTAASAGLIGWLAEGLPRAFSPLHPREVRV